MAKYKKLRTISVSDLAYYSANPDNFIRYKTTKNDHAIQKGLIAHGHGYKKRSSNYFMVAAILIVLLIITLVYWY